MGAAAAMVAVFGAGCAREAARVASPSARAEIAFAAPDGAEVSGCSQVGESRVSVLHPPVLDRLREDAASGRRMTARLDDAHIVHAWLSGSVEEGYRVRVNVVDAGGNGGPSLEIADDLGGVVGRPEVSFAADGRGEVTYLASTQSEFRLVVTPLRCNAR